MLHLEDHEEENTVEPRDRVTELIYLLQKCLGCLLKLNTLSSLARLRSTFV